ncbi:MAG: hypothetical protein CM15mP73_5470 [Hyphomicrobiales bacterium]|nr:MAG: hypothetical protein CM15mP73_5470 [Hyphomicrobiales bacterium]
MTDDNEPLTITIDKNSKIYIQEMEIDFDDLTEKLEAIGRSNFDQKSILMVIKILVMKSFKESNG